MQENITVIDEEYKTILGKGSKKAKMGEVKVININKYSKKQLSEPASNEEAETEVTTPQQVEEPATNTALEQKVEAADNKITQFPSKEIFENRLAKSGVTCYNNFPGESIKTNAARRLRTASVVPETLILTTNSVGIENVEVKKEVDTENKIIQFPNKETFDFSQLVNQTTANANEGIKSMPSIDDYFKKEVALHQEERNVDNTSTELETAINNYETVLESYKTQCELQEQLERELQELRQQRVIKIEEYRQKTLEETQNLNDVLAKINQLKDAIDEEKRALGLIENSDLLSEETA